VVARGSGFLLDTNVISELMKPRPARKVADWIESISEELLYLSVLTIGEVRRGIDLLGDTDPKRARLQSWLDYDVRVRFQDRLLDFDAGVAERWGQLEALAKKRRVTLPTVDAQLAATALHHGLTFVTRNTSDLDPMGVPLLNPWAEISPRH
jgi:predicted nucleic acid-binding protein